MPITIGSNIISLQIQRAFSDATKEVSTSSERLASGLRINRASDDAAGLAISESLDSDSKVFSQAIKNVNDGISALTIAESAVAELSDIVVRIRELATQSANGAISNEQRASLDEEAQALSKEFTRIQQSTEFNGMGLLNGATSDVRIQAGYGLDGSISSTIGEFLGNGTFSLETTYSFTFALDTAVADFNLDGFLDFIACGINNKAEVYLGNGNGSFDTSGTLTVGVCPEEIAIGDLNQDGFLDIITGNTSDEDISVILGNGNGTFQEAVTIGVENYVSGIALGDINGDEILDIITSSSSTSEATVILGNGDGSFQNAYTMGVSHFSNDIALEDLNNDGILDIITANSSDGSSSVMLGNGNGTFRDSVDYEAGSGTLFVTLGDVNGDDILDIVTANSDAYNSSVFLGNGNGTFQSQVSYAVGRDPRQVTLEDLNGDGALDLVASVDFDNSTTVLFGNGNGTFQDAVTYSIGGDTAVFGDFDSDGVVDMVAGGEAGLAISLGDVRSGVGPLLEFSLKSRLDALQALAPLDRKLEILNTQRGFIGAFQSRLDVSKNVLQVSVENFMAADDRIKNVDVAFEAAKLIRNQILQEASTAVLAQANQQPAMALKMLS